MHAARWDHSTHRALRVKYWGKINKEKKRRDSTGGGGERLKKQACCHTEDTLQNIKPRCLGDFFSRKSEEWVKHYRALWSWCFVLLYCSPRKIHKECVLQVLGIYLTPGKRRSNSVMVRKAYGERRTRKSLVCSKMSTIKWIRGVQVVWCTEWFGW